MRIPRHLYKVTHTHESTHATGFISAIELHRHLWHIAIASARKLVESGAITGIKLDLNSQEHECGAYMYAWATPLDIQKPPEKRPPEQIRGPTVEGAPSVSLRARRCGAQCEGRTCPHRGHRQRRAR
jgi:hypothetical protein